MDFTFKIDYLLVGLMQVIGFFIQGTTGFGCTVIAAPVTNGLLGTTMGVPYGTAITIPFLYYLAVKGRKDISWKDLGKIVVLCAPGILIGQYLFYQISPETAKVLIGAMVTIIALMNLHKYVIKPLVIKEMDDVEVADTLVKRTFRYGCLILGGIVHGAFNIGGPLITVYTLEAVKDKKKFRNTMTMLWVVLNSWNLFNQHQNGAFTNELNSALLIALPLAGIGFFFGMRFLEKINREQFLRIVYVVLLIIGSNMLLSNIPWTADSKMMSMIGTAIVLAGYTFNVFKKRKVNVEKLQTR
ncbi:sulfite exporter TauE/SafE family protein [Enterovibrio sp. ZSDZ35]|uniref:Probable membrane transporter protein n=1 Tax=Enterovibrio qingdaonensis TaxID=2899818 RepID=A0ABT5QR04_9GAMM|nr:sulfite exporter TauE/SafE family protein [Enterovibrio sp. ZSDZ35]MDD1783411.1 sulfite exporter TauE/SafE family protein [Enterovibrio sp. ZSDZ35]